MCLNDIIIELEKKLPELENRLEELEESQQVRIETLLLEFTV